MDSCGQYWRSWLSLTDIASYNFLCKCNHSKVDIVFILPRSALSSASHTQASLAGNYDDCIPHGEMNSFCKHLVLCNYILHRINRLRLVPLKYYYGSRSYRSIIDNPLHSSTNLFVPKLCPLNKKYFLLDYLYSYVRKECSGYSYQS